MPPDEEPDPAVQPETKEDGSADEQEEMTHPPPNEKERPIMDTTYMNGYTARVFTQYRRTRESGAAEAFAAKRDADEDLMLRLMGYRKRKPKPGE